MTENNLTTFGKITKIQNYLKEFRNYSLTRILNYLTVFKKAFQKIKKIQNNFKKLLQKLTRL